MALAAKKQTNKKLRNETVMDEGWVPVKPVQTLDVLLLTVPRRYFRCDFICFMFGAVIF